jgi:hypothetical protein
VRATAGSWDSVDGNEASAVVGIMSTTFKACVSNAPETTNAGDNDGYESNPARACVSDGSTAVDAGSGDGGTSSCGTGSTPSVNKDRHRFWGFALDACDGHVGRQDGSGDAGDRQHWRNDEHLRAALVGWRRLADDHRSEAVTDHTSTIYTFGSTTDTWGRWALDELERELPRPADRCCEQNTSNSSWTTSPSA